MVKIWPQKRLVRSGCPISSQRGRVFLRGGYYEVAVEIVTDYRTKRRIFDLNPITAKRFIKHWIESKNWKIDIWKPYSWIMRPKQAIKPNSPAVSGYNTNGSVSCQSRMSDGLNMNRRSIKYTNLRVAYRIPDCDYSQWNMDWTKTVFFYPVLNISTHWLSYNYETKSWIWIYSWFFQGSRNIILHPS